MMCCRSVAGRGNSALFLFFSFFLRRFFFSRTARAHVSTYGAAALKNFFWQFAVRGSRLRTLVLDYSYLGQLNSHICSGDNELHTRKGGYTRSLSSPTTNAHLINMAPVDCVVIGAGLAGLQAARRLKDEGVSGASSSSHSLSLSLFFARRRAFFIFFPTHPPPPPLLPCTSDVVVARHH